MFYCVFFSQFLMFSDRMQLNNKWVTSNQQHMNDKGSNTLDFKCNLPMTKFKKIYAWAEYVSLGSSFHFSFRAEYVSLGPLLFSYFMFNFSCFIYWSWICFAWLTISTLKLLSGLTYKLTACRNVHSCKGLLDRLIAFTPPWHSPRLDT